MLIWPKKWNIIKIGKETLILDNIKIKKKKTSKESYCFWKLRY